MTTETRPRQRSTAECIMDARAAGNQDLADLLQAIGRNAMPEPAPAPEPVPAAHAPVPAAPAALWDPLEIATARELTLLQARDRARKIYAQQTDPDGDSQGPDLNDWEPVDLAAWIDGTRTPPAATLMPRSDGQGLLYPGLTHSMHGESESGKSLIAQAEAVRVLNTGGRVLFLDFESDPASVTGRLRELGADMAAVRERFVYLHPETSMNTDPERKSAWARILEQPFDLAVIDGVTASVAALEIGESKDNDAMTKWAKMLPDRIAQRTGAAVVSIDHVTKNADTRGRHAIGGQAKMANLTGTAYIVEPLKPIGKGLRGEISLRQGKDRPGTLRAVCGPWRASDRTQEAAVVVVDAARLDGQTRVTIEPPRDLANGPANPAASFRPTGLMQAVSEWLTTYGPAPQAQILKGVTGKDSAIAAALRTLIAEGHVTVTDGPRGSKTHHLIRDYRETDDRPAST